MRFPRVIALVVPFSILHFPFSLHAQSASSATFKVTTQAVEPGGSPTTPTASALTSAGFKAVVNIGRAADNLKSTASFKVREGYIPTLEFAPAGQPPPPPVVTTQAKKTNDNTPTIRGTSAPGVTIRIYEGAALLGSDTVSPSGVWAVTSSLLTEGPHAVFARAANAAGESGPSNSVVITVDTIPPAPPAGLRVQGFDGGADLFWQPNTEPDLRGYNIFRKDPGASLFVKINTGNPVVGTRFRDTGITNNLTYCYKITAVDDAFDPDP